MSLQTQGLLPAQHHAEFAGGVHPTALRGQGQLSLLPSKSSYVTEQNCLGKLQDWESASGSALLFPSPKFLSFFSFSLSLFSPQSLAIHPPLLPWLHCLDVLVLSYLITFNSFLHSIDFAITESICCIWPMGGWESCFSNGFFPP